MRSAVQQCLAADNILLKRKGTVLFSFLRSLLREMADRFASQGYSLKKTNSVIKW